VNSSRASTVRAIKAGDKQAALWHARHWKTLNSSKEQCGNFMDRIDEVLTSIADAEATQKVNHLPHSSFTVFSKLTKKFEKMKCPLNQTTTV
jgi:hypothetical protein